MASQLKNIHFCLHSKFSPVNFGAVNQSGVFHSHFLLSAGDEQEEQGSGVILIKKRQVIGEYTAHRIYGQVCENWIETNCLS